MVRALVVSLALVMMVLKAAVSVTVTKALLATCVIPAQVDTLEASVNNAPTAVLTVIVMMVSLILVSVSAKMDGQELNVILAQVDTLEAAALRVQVTVRMAVFAMKVSRAPVTVCVMVSSLVLRVPPARMDIMVRTVMLVRHVFREHVKTEVTAMALACVPLLPGRVICVTSVARAFTESLVPSVLIVITASVLMASRVMVNVFVNLVSPVRPATLVM